jgi:hypothetical protein
MSNTAIEIVELLNQLIEACHASERNLTIAADSVRSVETKRLFATYAKQRRRFADELRVELARLGGILESGNEPAVSRITPRPGAAIQDDALVSLVAEAENQLLVCYEGAEHTDVQPPLRMRIDRQRMAIKAARDCVQNLPRHSKRSA